MSESGWTWQVLIHRTADKTLQRLPKNLVRRIWAELRALARDPQPEGCKKLTGYKDRYRLRVRVRVGDWRITYQVEDDRLIILVLEIAPRGGAYRNI
jgi:mRNA interferase RelE/StbE